MQPERSAIRAASEPIPSLRVDQRVRVRGPAPCPPRGEAGAGDAPHELVEALEPVLEDVAAGGRAAQGPVTTSRSPGTAPARPGTRSLVPNAVTDENQAVRRVRVSPDDRDTRLVQPLVELDHLRDLRLRGRAEADEQSLRLGARRGEVAQVDRRGLVAEIARRTSSRGGSARPRRARPPSRRGLPRGSPRRPRSWPVARPRRSSSRRSPTSPAPDSIQGRGRRQGPEPAPIPVRPARTASEAMRAAPRGRVLEALAAGEERRQARGVRAAGAVGRVRLVALDRNRHVVARRRRASPPPRSPCPPVTITAERPQRVDLLGELLAVRVVGYGTPASAQASCRFGVTTVASGSSLPTSDLDRVVLQELRARGRDHHRVDDERNADGRRESPRRSR